MMHTEDANLRAIRWFHLRVKNEEYYTSPIRKMNKNENRIKK